MPSTVKLVAEALAYRWGELQETPPEFIGDLMIELIMALDTAQRSGDEERAECLDEVLDALAEGIYRYEHQADPDVGKETLDRAITEIRTYYYLKSGIPKGEAQGLERAGGEQKGTVDISVDRDQIATISN